MLKVIVGIVLSLFIAIGTQASTQVPVKNKFTYGERIILERYNRYIDLVHEASSLTGVDMNELAAFVKIESTFNKNAYNKKYAAAGLLGHLPSTWETRKKIYGKRMGISRKAEVYNAKASLYIGAAALADERRELALKTNRRPEQIGSGDLYLAHMYGLTRAVKLINAPANAKVGRYVRISKNSGLGYYKGKRVTTMGEFRMATNYKLEQEKSLFRNKTKDYQLTKLINSLQDHGRRVFAYNN